MIVGTGTDIVKIPRITQVFTRHHIRFVHRILTPTETSRFHQRLGQNTYRGMAYLATRFALKEAAIKALQATLPVKKWHALESSNNPQGALSLRWHGAEAAGSELCLHASVSDEIDYAQAFVVAERIRPCPYAQKQNGVDHQLQAAYSHRKEWLEDLSALSADIAQINHQTPPPSRSRAIKLNAQ